MITLTRFSQERQLQLQAIVDRDTRDGVCVGLCDYWLSQIKSHSDLAPAERLQLLRDNFGQIMNHQRHYAGLRDRRGREHARREVGDQLGLRYHTDDTAIMRTRVGIGGIRTKLAGDIGRVGAAASWTLEFADGTRHAIAGFCGISGGPGPISHLRSHVFDPNIGEYVGPFRELDYILSDLLSKFPSYGTVTDVYRTTEGR
jgi:hypothetical protein